MATLLGWNRGAVRARVHCWRDCGLALIVAMVLLAGTAEVHAAGCGNMPGQMCPTGTSDGPVSVTTRQSADSTASVSGTSMAINTSVAVNVAMTGVAVAAAVLPMGRVLTVTADVVAAAGRMAIRSGLPQAAALAIIASIGSENLQIDSSGHIVSPALSPAAADAGFNGFVWVIGSQASGDSPVAACNNWAAKYGSPNTVVTSFDNGACVGTWAGHPSPGVVQIPVQSGSCVASYVSSGARCVPDPAGPKQPATDAQIENAIKGAPSSWPQIFNAAGCGKANSFMDAASADLNNDPCAVIITGSVPQSNGVTWPNGNTATFPSRTTTTTGTDADGRPTTTNTTTTTSATLSGTGSRTQPVSATPTTTTTTVTNRTNADGSTTSTTTTSTTTSPDQSSTQDDAATFAGPDIQLYKQKSKTFGDVLTGFRTRVAAMPWYTAMVGFFNVTISSGSCPHWVVPASRWNQALDGNAYFCSSTAMGWYQLGGIVVLIVAAWAAFRIAFL